MSFGSNVTPKRFGADKVYRTTDGEKVELEVTVDPDPVPDLPITWNDTTLNDCYRCGHRGNNPVPGCECCAREHHYAPPDPED